MAARSNSKIFPKLTWAAASPVAGIRGIPAVELKVVESVDKEFVGLGVVAHEFLGPDKLEFRSRGGCGPLGDRLGHGYTSSVPVAQQRSYSIEHCRSERRDLDTVIRPLERVESNSLPWAHLLT